MKIHVYHAQEDYTDNFDGSEEEVFKEISNRFHYLGKYKLKNLDELVRKLREQQNLFVTVET